MREWQIREDDRLIVAITVASIIAVMLPLSISLSSSRFSTTNWQISFSKKMYVCNLSYKYRSTCTCTTYFVETEIFEFFVQRKNSKMLYYEYRFDMYFLDILRWIFETRKLKDYSDHLEDCQERW